MELHEEYQNPTQDESQNESRDNVGEVNEKKDFWDVCKPINLEKEYRDYVGKEKWAIITSLSENELLKEYPDEIQNYTPYILLTDEQGKVILDNKRETYRKIKQSKKYEDPYGYVSGITEIHHPEISEPDFSHYREEKINREIERDQEIVLMHQAIGSLTERQYKYLIERYVKNKSNREIAKSEGIAHQIVDRQIFRIIKKFKKIFADYLVE